MTRSNIYLEGGGLIFSVKCGINCENTASGAWGEYTLHIHYSIPRPHPTPYQLLINSPMLEQQMNK
jgi:hypothetical protein